MSHIRAIVKWSSLAAMSALVAGCVSAGAVPPSSPAPTDTLLPTIAPASSGSTPANPGRAFSSRVGLGHGIGWQVSSDGLSLSSDGGRTWRTALLPDGVTASQIAAVVVTPGRGTWLAATSAAGVSLYAGLDPDPVSAPTSAWKVRLLAPSKVEGLDINGLQPQVAIVPGPGHLVVVSETYMWSMSSGATWLYISTDDGITFVEHAPSPRGAVYGAWDSMAFDGGTSGLAVTGLASANLFRTSDGGGTWSQVAMAMLPDPNHRAFGSPLNDGSKMLLPVVLFSDDGTARFEILATQDGGASFAAGESVGIGGASLVASDNLGAVVWAIPSSGDFAFLSSDDGRTWSSIPTKGLPSGVVSIAARDGSSATAEIQQGGCKAAKTDCWQQWELFTTVDGGRNWVPV
jgi:hypothetical protein